MRAIVISLALCGLVSAAPAYHTTKIPVSGGAELVTIFADGVGENAGLPLVSVLRDTLGDPDPQATRLREVWAFTYARPTGLQRVAAGIPFFFHRSEKNAGDEDRAPAALLNLSDPKKTSVTHAAVSLTQAGFVDPVSIAVRASSRTYETNYYEYRHMHLERAAEALEALSQPGAGQNDFSEREIREIEARLGLDKKMLGGFVSAQRLERVSEKQREESNLDREHNWEVLRQRAEANTLYFDPLPGVDGVATQALLWVAESDLARATRPRWDHALLNIDDPWNDAQLRKWDGYRETWYFDAADRRVAETGEVARTEKMIPLAVYSLDCPKAPLLLVDFRNEWNPKRREMVRRTTETFVSGLLGWNGTGNLEYYAGKKIWLFIRGHQGVAVDRDWRLDSYAEFRQTLLLDSKLNPQFRQLMLERLDGLALNPFEQHSSVESELAQRQYTALVKYAQRPDGLPKQLEKEREKELTAVRHGAGKRALYTTATVASGGLYRHRETVSESAIVELAQRRRVAEQVAFLERVLASGPRIDVTYDPARVQAALGELTNLGSDDPKVARVVRQVYGRTRDEATRRECLRCLAQLKAQPPQDLTEYAAGTHD